MAILNLLGVALLGVSAVAHPTERRQNDNTEEPGIELVYDFANITASTELNWVPCFGEGFECTYLTVPLDYADPDVGTTNVAFVKYSVPNETGTDSQDILYNPGGPNGSGVGALVSSIEEFIETFGPGYTFVSFDPRGVNNTGPVLNCFNTTEERADYISLTTPSSPLPELWQSAKAMGQFCTRNNEGKATKYAGTPAVVQDMMHFVELRAQEAGREPAEEKIWYYGLSYGTIVGQTLSAMYPDRLGRVILDGNVNGKEHYQGYVPSDVDDTDRAFQFFAELCFEAGQDCEFAGNSTSAAQILDRLRNVVNKLENEPLVRGPASPTIIKRHDFLGTAIQALYGPMNGYTQIAFAAAAVEYGNLTAYEQLKETSQGSGSAPHNPNWDGAAQGDALTIITSIDCADRYPLKTLEDYKEAYADVTGRSCFSGRNTAANNVLICNGMNFIPPESQAFTGFDCSSPITTNVPILFIGTTGDPITPMTSAYYMSKVFPGSTVLEQYSGGHGFRAVKSNCTTNYVQAYLKDLTLPPAGTVCQTDVAAKEYFVKPEQPGTSK